MMHLLPPRQKLKPHNRTCADRHLRLEIGLERPGQKRALYLAYRALALFDPGDALGPKKSCMVFSASG